MDVNITDYGQGERNFVEYIVSGLAVNQLEFLNENLTENTEIAEDNLIITWILMMSCIRFKVKLPNSDWRISFPVKKLK